MRVTFLDIKNNRQLRQFEGSGPGYILPREGETFAIHQPNKQEYAKWAEYAVREVIHLYKHDGLEILVLCVPQKQDRVATERLRGLLRLGG
jgi:hypothetical protein